MPFFSIITPVYNTEKYLNECIQSVLSQTFADYECVLVDDGSPDNCPAICDEYAKKDKRIKVIHKENSGPSDARNTGILQATGGYVVLLDSDDKFADNNTLQNLFDVIQEYKTDVIVNVNWFRFTDNGKIKKIKKYNKKIVFGLPKEIVRGFEKSECCLALCWFVTNREYLIKNKLFFKKGILHEDDHWVPRVLFTTQQKIAVNHSPFYAYRVGREGSTMAKISPKRVLSLLEIVDDLIEWSKDEKTYTKEGRGFMLKKAAELCYEGIYISPEIKHQDKNLYQDVYKKFREKLKTLPKYTSKKKYIAIMLFGAANARRLQKMYLAVKKRFIKSARD
ncbi:MAG: glycosyltransferase [Spirochaetes bacterium]|nr:glycosyltransferase [Spirochaetota bacterium]